MKIDMTGEYFGNLKVLFYYRTFKTKAYWLCECACGNFKVIQGKRLRSGNTTSCGCKIFTHGMTGSRIHSTWKNIKSRCKNPAAYKYNSDRFLSISICDEWENSFETFYDWAINSGYSDDLTIDRIDGSKGYSPDNCRWVTRKQQSNNRSSNRILTIDGISHTLSEWADISGINSYNIKSRLRLNWDEKSAVFTSVRKFGVNKSKQDVIS